MGRRQRTRDPNGTNNWFMDPTPFEHSEFLGNIINAFSGDAPGGGPAAGKGDFYTVVAAEMTHCMGLFGEHRCPAGLADDRTPASDTAEGGGVGNSSGYSTDRASSIC